MSFLVDLVEKKSGDSLFTWCFKRLLSGPSIFPKRTPMQRRVSFFGVGSPNWVGLGKSTRKTTYICFGGGPTSCSGCVVVGGTICDVGFTGNSPEFPFWGSLCPHTSRVGRVKNLPFGGLLLSV